MPATPVAAVAVGGSQAHEAAKLSARSILSPCEEQPARPSFAAPTVGSAMCEAQRIDLAAARAGKISWRQYYAMWGPG
jgi:hypothetical protein